MAFIIFHHSIKIKNFPARNTFTIIPPVLGEVTSFKVYYIRNHNISA
jgi:hypothetical protein